MNWDDDDFSVTPAKTKTTIINSWEDDLDEPLLDDFAWDDDEDDKTEKKPAIKGTKPKPKAPVVAKGKKGSKKTSSNDRVLLEVDTLDEATRKKLLKEKQLESDLNNAADLFGTLGVADDYDDDAINEHPKAKALKEASENSSSKPQQELTVDTPLTVHPIFDPESKQDYEKLRKQLSSTLTPLAKKSSLNYSSQLAIGLIRDLSKELSSENIRKVISTLNVIVKEKTAAERQARLAKTGGASVGGGKKKVKGKINLGGGFKKDNDLIQPYSKYDDDGYDDFDDFM
ncbi:translation initiation factor eIF3 core subunit j [Ascoidea rubescens DSM 1968]|uniref:Eukaryotic translation initiation factor 3 subunit J n=1 Tax=Ascoidea rubescens DSM 1968 TaxID=1344418 RepID=A0A1D2VLX2_9ASCO|nr:translation initiation factor eIF3 subunit [Ascoidea rubescens DSM 1968]ODV62601.1 translation initiation factor eIF3 subunit [Ascoidea rubescens DSM 1968]